MHILISHFRFKLFLAVVLLLGLPFASIAEGRTKIFSATNTINSIDIVYKGSQPKTTKFLLPGDSKNPATRLIIDLKNSEIVPPGINNRFRGIPFEFRVAQFNPNTVRMVLTSRNEELLSNVKLNIKTGKVQLAWVSNDQVPNTVYGRFPKLGSQDPNKTIDVQEAAPTPKDKEEKKESESKNDGHNHGADRTEHSLEEEIQIISNQYIVLKKKSYEELEIQLGRSDSPITKYEIIHLKNPDRLVIDIYGWKDKVEIQKLIDIKLPTQNLITKIRAGYPDKSTKVRLVLDLGEVEVGHIDSLTEKKYLVLKLKEGKLSKRLTKEQLAKFIVLLDAGHGGYDSGALYNGVEEKHLTMKITEKLHAELKKAGLKPKLTRSNDTFLSLDERVEEVAEVHPDLFVSVHCNALQSNKDISGIETYFYTQNSKSLAVMLHKQLLADTGAADRRVRRARFVVIKKNTMPSVLLETGFLSNPKERKKLKTDEYQDLLAKSITQGIIKYLSNKNL